MSLLLNSLWNTIINRNFPVTINKDESKILEMRQSWKERSENLVAEKCGWLKKQEEKHSSL